MGTQKKDRKGMSIRVKIVGLGLIFISVSIIAVAVIGYFIARNSLIDQAMASLEAARDSRKSQIERFFNERVGDIKVLASNPVTINAVRDLSNVFEKTGGAKGGAYKGLLDKKFKAPGEYRNVHDRYFKIYNQFMEEYGYYDIFLMDPRDGDTFFTVTKEGDFGQRTSDVDSSLRDVWKSAKDGAIKISDTRPYKPSGNIPAQFIAAPVKSNGRIIGILAFQVSIGAIGKIMQERSGMGRTGEAYLVGRDNLMRSDSYLDKENRTVKASFANPEKGKVNTEATRNAFAGKEETKIVMDYNGNPVLSSYTTVSVGDTEWALMADIDEAEVNEPVVLFRNIILAVTIFLLAAAGFYFLSCHKQEYCGPHPSPEGNYRQNGRG